MIGFYLCIGVFLAAVQLVGSFVCLEPTDRLFPYLWLTAVVCAGLAVAWPLVILIFAVLIIRENKAANEHYKKLREEMHK